MLDYERFIRVPMEGGQYYGPSNYGIDYSQINGWGIYEWSPLITYGSIFRSGPSSYDISATDRPNFCIFKGKLYQAMWNKIDPGIAPTDTTKWRDISEYIFNYTDWSVVENDTSIEHSGNGVFDITFSLDVGNTVLGTIIKITKYNDTDIITNRRLERHEHALLYTSPEFSHTEVYLDGYRVPNYLIHVNRSALTSLTDGDGNSYQDAVYSYITLSVYVDGMYANNTFNAPFYDVTNKILKAGTQIQIQYKYTRI